MAKPKINARPKDRIWQQWRICYMHVNKAASNSINHALGRGLGKETTKMRAMEIREPEKWLIFAFVREPWERIVSSYAHNIKQGKLTGPQKARGFKRDMTLAQFIDAVCAMKDWEMDKHMVPQAYRLSDDKGHLIPNWIGKMERIEQDWPGIRKRLIARSGREVPYTLPWIKKRYYWRMEIPLEDLRSEDLWRRVRRRFAADYELLGYV